VEGRHVVDARTIDEVNILQAAMLAMETSVGKLPRKPDFVLVDGNRLPMVIPVPRLSTSRLLLHCRSVCDRKGSLTSQR